MPHIYIYRCTGFHWYSVQSNVLLIRRHWCWFHQLPDCRDDQPWNMSNGWFPHCSATQIKGKEIKISRRGRSWSRSLGSQPTGDIVINSVVGCQYFPPGPRLPFQSESITALGNAWWTTCPESLPGSVSGESQIGDIYTHGHIYLIQRCHRQPLRCTV